MKKKNNILFLCQFFYPEYISSATLPYDTACALKDAGYSVDVLCGYPQEYTTKERLPVKETINGIGIHRIKYLQMSRKSFIGRLVNYFSLTLMMFFHLFEMAKYRSIIVYSNPPILPLLAAWAKRLFGTNLVFVAYDLYPEIAINTNSLRKGSLINRVMNFINRRVYTLADFVVALSKEMKEYICQNRPISSEKVVVIPNWYEDFGPLDTPKQENPFREIIKDRFVVSYFGNMGIAQDMETILDAMILLKEDKDICFLFAGHGNKLDSVRETVAKENIENAIIYDFLHGEDFQNALKISDCALISLTKGVVGLCVPSKTYSYMMQGIPLLAIMDDCDIVRDIQNGAGLAVKNGEAKQLANQIKNLKASPDALIKMRTTCREIYLSKYTRSICTQKYVDLFEKSISL